MGQSANQEPSFVFNFKELTEDLLRKWINKGARDTSVKGLVRISGSVPATFVSVLSSVVFALRNSMGESIEPSGRCLQIQILCQAAASLITTAQKLQSETSSMDEACRLLSSAKFSFIEENAGFCKMGDIYMRSIGLLPVEEIYMRLMNGKLPKAIATRLNQVGHKFGMAAKPWMVSAMLREVMVEQGLRKPTPWYVRSFERLRAAASDAPIILINAKDKIPFNISQGWKLAKSMLVQNFESARAATYRRYAHAIGKHAHG